MRILFTRYAKQELDDAVRYYELAAPGLGRSFRADVQKAAMRIVEYPQAWSVYRGDVRKCLLHRFPYSLLYSIEEDHILVIAVAHQHRRPYYWIDSGD